jgi:hypothetical protein
MRMKSGPATAERQQTTLRAGDLWARIQVGSFGQGEHWPAAPSNMNFTGHQEIGWREGGVAEMLQPDLRSCKVRNGL